MVRIQEIDKLKYGCSLCFTDIGAGPLVQFTNYSGMNKEDVEWTCDVCCLENTPTGWLINHSNDLHESSEQVSNRHLFPIHTACWRLLEVCWDSKTPSITPLNLTILADFFVSQPRGWQLPHMLEGNWVFSGLKFLTGDYTRYRDPDDYARVAEALELLVFPDTWPRFRRKNRMHGGREDCFSLLPLELRLMVLCYLPTDAVEAVREASGGMAFVPLEGTFWLSRLSEPEYCHLPRQLAQLSGDQKPGDVPQWFLALQEEKTRNKNRLRIISYCEMLIDKMIQRQIYLREYEKRDISHVPFVRSVPLVECPDEPHPAYQKSEHTLSWTSEIFFGKDKPLFSAVKALTPTYTASYGGKYLSSLIFHTEKEDLILGHRSAKPGIRIDISDPKAWKNNVILQSDSRGVFEVRTQRNGTPFSGDYGDEV
ncbi:MAG: hypothetical protein Q9174_004153 [Haloplaca sp. 1 TL-2023]